MKNLIQTIVVVFILLTSMKGSASFITLAENIHTNGGGNNDYSFEGTIGAENFTLFDDFTISSVSTTVHKNSGSALVSSINWWLYDDNTNTPGDILYSGNNYGYTSTFLHKQGRYDITNYEIDLSAESIHLSAGSYWLGFQLNTNNLYGPHWSFASSGTSFDNLSAISIDNGNVFTNNYPGGNLAFSIKGSAVSVSEPHSIVIFLLGLLVIAFFLKSHSVGIKHSY